MAGGIGFSANYSEQPHVIDMVYHLHRWGIEVVLVTVFCLQVELTKQFVFIQYKSKVVSSTQFSMGNFINCFGSVWKACLICVLDVAVGLVSINKEIQMMCSHKDLLYLFYL